VPAAINWCRLSLAVAMSLLRCVILIVQRKWAIAHVLSAAFEANDARVLLANNARTALALADAPDLSAAVLDSESRRVCKRLAERSVPFVLYTGREHIDDECAEGATVRKPATSEAVVLAVKQQLLSK
jgi:DNA-binding response OmpR family regulator